MIDIIVPFEQEGTKAIVRSWLKNIGDAVAIDEPLVELETDKVTQEVPSPGSGILAEILLDSDAEATPGALLGRLRMGSAVDSAQAATAEPERQADGVRPTALSAISRIDPELRLSPSVRRAVMEHGLDPGAIAGTGRGGRVTRADVERTLAHNGGAPVVSTVSPQAQPRSAARSHDVPHDRMRRLIADNMLKSVTSAPHVTAVFEADFSRIIAHRSANKAAFEREGASLTFTSYIVLACAKAMGVAPAINSRWYEDRLEIFDDIDIGVGTALGEKGLIVPVVRGVQNLTLLQVAQQLHDLTTRARANKLRPADVQGGTFSISNHGVSGSLVATPIIINQPQSAILGVGKLEKRVVVRSVDGVDAIQIRPMCYVSLTIDHRVVDGHQTNAWLSKFVETLENWPL